MAWASSGIWWWRATSRRRSPLSPHEGRGEGRSTSPLRDALVPVQHLLAVPVQHAVESADVVVDLLEILDPVRLAADVGMDSDGAELRPRLALGVEPVELVDGALQEVF